MPRGAVPRYKIIHCHQCEKEKRRKVVIARFDRSKYSRYKVPMSEILKKIRSHYKKHHPGKFREQIKKALKTKRKKGIINKHKRRRRKK